MKKNLTISYEQFHDWKSLEDKDQALVLRAYEVCETAWAPYSKFRVGAAVLMETGEIITGSNQENVAYPSGLCAERVALFYAGANLPKTAVETICIVAKGTLIPEDTNLSPCGGCRQVMLETENRQAKPYRVILVNQNGSATVFSSAKDLLPLAFGIFSEE